MKDQWPPPPPQQFPYLQAPPPPHTNQFLQAPPPPQAAFSQAAPPQGFNGFGYQGFNGFGYQGCQGYAQQQQQQPQMDGSNFDRSNNRSSGKGGDKGRFVKGGGKQQQNEAGIKGKGGRGRGNKGDHGMRQDREMRPENMSSTLHMTFADFADNRFQPPGSFADQPGFESSQQWQSSGFGIAGAPSDFASAAEMNNTFQQQPGMKNKKGKKAANQTPQPPQMRTVFGQTFSLPQPPSVEFAHLLRATKARLRHVTPPERRLAKGGVGGAPTDGRRGKPSEPASSGASKAMRVNWILPERPVTNNAQAEAEEPQPEKKREELYKTVKVSIESTVPTGCQVTLDLNGQSSILKPGTKKNDKQARDEKIFTIAPLQAGNTDGGNARKTSLTTQTEVEGDADVAQAAPRGSFIQEPGELSLDMDDSAEAVAQTWSSGPAPASGPAAFSATITLDTGELQARTRQELLEPELDIMEIHDNAVVLKLSGLTGDRFEVTVYASGTSETPGAPATFQQRGPVRGTESVHRMGNLESAQVYVAWVRVFSENQTMESKQKGFKTLQARVKTIWDEPDHDILGVSSMATRKEIIKAWRQLSLEHHPDKVIDEDKKRRC